MNARKGHARKSLIVFGTAGVAILAAALFLAGNPVSNNTLTTSVQRADAAVTEPPASKSDNESIVTSLRTVDDYLTETGKSVVKIEWPSEKVSIKKGSEVNLAPMAKHLAGANADQSVTVRVLPPDGYVLYPPSVAESTTSEQRFEAQIAGTPLPGGIDLGTLLRINAPNDKAVSKGDSGAFDISITIPENFPDTVKEFELPIIVEATDGNGNAVPTQASGIMIEVQ